MVHLACVQGCEGRHDVFRPLFSCPSCDGLIDVVLDDEDEAGRTAAGWRALLDERAASTAPVDRSGVWAHREWVMPGLAVEDVVTLGEGRSPLVPTELFSFPTYVKQCGQQPSGSFKDLGMTVLVSMARAMKRRGEDVRALICASTGDTSAALAAYGARAGIPVVVLLPAGKVSPAQLVQPIAAGAHVLMLDGDFDACMRVVQKVSQLPGMFLANSKNPLRLQGQATVAYEIARDLGWRAPAFVAVPSGNLGNVAALHAGFARLLRLGLIATMPRLIACQVDAANPLFRWWRAGGAGALQPVTATETHASAIRIGDPVSFPRAKKALLARAGSAGSGGSSLFADEAQGFGGQGLVTSCSEPELLHAMARADREGLFVCPHTAAALGGLAQLERARSSPLQSHLDVVVVSTASGLKFAEQKAAFHEGSTGLGALDLPASTSSLRNPPLRLPATLDDVQRALHARGIG